MLKTLPCVTEKFAFAATGGATVTGSVAAGNARRVTAATSLWATPLLKRQVKESLPPKPACGVTVKEPSALRYNVPFAGTETRAALRPMF